jgi:tetratricopeptide (TPR) repeat protein
MHRRPPSESSICRKAQFRLGQMVVHVVHAAAAAALLLGGALVLHAQFSADGVELSSSVNLDEADSTVRAHLERVTAYVADRQWDEAVETLRQVLENQGSKLIAIRPGRYVNVADYCQAQLAALPEEGLALYRQRVDELARQWYEDGLARRSAPRLAEVVDKLFCSTWGDDALLALGEIELEKGNYEAARGAWGRLIEVPPARVDAARFTAAREQAGLAAEQAARLDNWYRLDGTGAKPFYKLRADETLGDPDAAKLVRFWKDQRLPPTRLAYPATTFAGADIRARLILVSILEGSLERARGELRAYERLHPGAEGRLAGRQVKYADALTALMASAERWPQPARCDDWETFAGTAERNAVSPRNFDPGPLAWTPISFGEPLSADLSNSRVYSLRRVGEDAQRLLSYHPLVVGDLILFSDQSSIFAFSAKTGAPAWPRQDPKRPSGEILADDTPAMIGRTNGRLGVPRFTMTAHRGKLYARMGPQVTTRPLEMLDGRASGYLVCLDLEAEGRLVWKLSLDKVDDEKWSFEGSPVVQGPDLYVAMRKSDVRPQAHVACFDVETKRMRWRTMVSAAETAGGGQSEEMTHNLLTLAQGTIYYNTNLGAVAAISARDGRLQWATLYHRARRAPDGRDRRAAHFYRDLNPCVYHRGTLYVAPADCESIFALDAGSGELLWETQLADDAVHLLGVGRGNLLASGDVLWWIDAERGKIIKRWPDTSPLGHGRGILMGEQVVWPTASELYIFEQDPSAAPRRLRDPISLSERGATGGNLVAADGLLLIAAADKLFALRQDGREPAPASAKAVADRPSGEAPRDPVK